MVEWCAPNKNFNVCAMMVWNITVYYVHSPTENRNRWSRSSNEVQTPPKEVISVSDSARWIRSGLEPSRKCTSSPPVSDRRTLLSQKNWLAPHSFNSDQVFGSIFLSNFESQPTASQGQQPPLLVAVANPKAHLHTLYLCEKKRIGCCDKKRIAYVIRCMLVFTFFIATHP